MARAFARDFYDSKAWRKTRRAYARSVHGICERCGEPGFMVHHKTELTPENINDDRIAFGFDNLELLCQTCHNQQHMRREPLTEGLMFTEDGDIVRAGSPPWVADPIGGTVTVRRPLREHTGRA